MLNQIEGTKLEMIQKFTSEGKRIVVTKVKTSPETKIGEVFKPGDKIKITGWSKGKGFAGVVKRWHFKGGPKTHGQSDRERAPGSIGQGTTPGRVFRGKKMAGRMGTDKVTISGVKVYDVDGENHFLLVTGLLPGSRNGRLVMMKIGETNA